MILISGRSGLKIGCSYISIAAKQEPTTLQLQDGNNWVGSSSAEKDMELQWITDWMSQQF